MNKSIKRFAFFKELFILFLHICLFPASGTNIYISNIESASEDSGCGLFANRIYKEFRINLWECSMYGYLLFFNLKLNVLSHLMRRRL